MFAFEFIISFRDKKSRYFKVKNIHVGKIKIKSEKMAKKVDKIFRYAILKSTKLRKVN